MSKMSMWFTAMSFMLPGTYDVRSPEFITPPEKPRIVWVSTGEDPEPDF